MAMDVDELVRNVLQTRFEVFADESVEDVKNQSIGLMEGAIGGVNDIGNSTVPGMIREWGGKVYTGG
jgi:hypothetical protein